MPLFRYEAEDKTGKVVRGVMDAQNEQQVAQNLNRMGYNARAVYGQNGNAMGQSQMQTATATRSTPSQAGGIQSVTLKSGVPVSVKSKVPASALAVFFRQLATLVTSGRPVIQSSGDIITHNSLLRSVLPDIQASLQMGQKLSSAMAAHPDIFPVHAIASVWSGEIAGKLEIALEEIALDFEAEASDTRFAKIGWGLTKANLIGIASMIPICNIFGYYIQPFMDGTGDAGVVARAMGHALLFGSLPSIIAMIAIWIAWGYAKRIPMVKRILDGILLRTPVFGKLHRCRSLSRFLHVLDGIYSIGVSPAIAWDAASLTPRNSEIAEKLKLARNQVPPDTSVVELLSLTGVFHMEDVGLLSAGEKAGRLPDALANLSAHYADTAASTRTIARLWSISANITFGLVIYGVAVIILIHGYASLLLKLLDL